MTSYDVGVLPGDGIGPEVTRERQARPRVTEGTPEQVANADILAFNDGIGARFYVGKYLLEREGTSFTE